MAKEAKEPEKPSRLPKLENILRMKDEHLGPMIYAPKKTGKRK